jgi:hypothetical protein
MVPSLALPGGIQAQPGFHWKRTGVRLFSEACASICRTAIEKAGTVRSDWAANPPYRITKDLPSKESVRYKQGDFSLYRVFRDHSFFPCD